MNYTFKLTSETEGIVQRLNNWHQGKGECKQKNGNFVTTMKTLLIGCGCLQIRLAIAFYILKIDVLKNQYGALIVTKNTGQSLQMFI